VQRTALSARELQVFHLLGEGRSTREIAEILNLSQHTIDTHRENIKGKLRLRSGNELVRAAVQWVHLGSHTAS
jgi:two-component system, NarL family, response regulator FusR